MSPENYDEIAGLFLRYSPELVSTFGSITDLLQKGIEPDPTDEKSREANQLFDTAIALANDLSRNEDLLRVLTGRYSLEVVLEFLSNRSTFLEILAVAFNKSAHWWPIDDDAFLIGGGVVPET